MKYIKRFFESKSDREYINIIEDILPNGFSVNVNDGKIIVTKILTDLEEIEEFKYNLETARRMGRIKCTDDEIIAEIRKLTESFDISELEDFLEKLDDKFCFSHHSNDYVTELEIDIIRERTNSKLEIINFIEENLSYLSDEHPFEIKIRDSDKLLLTEITFNKKVYLSKIKDYIIPLIDMIDSEFTLSKFNGNNIFMDAYSVMDYQKIDSLSRDLEVRYLTIFIKM